MWNKVINSEIVCEYYPFSFLKLSLQLFIYIIWYIVDIQRHDFNAEYQSILCGFLLWEQFYIVVTIYISFFSMYQILLPNMLQNLHLVCVYWILHKYDMH
jgi:uncharacterized BrkB/YihY/UPF0761 family membrane protein